MVFWAAYWFRREAVISFRAKINTRGSLKHRRDVLQSLVNPLNEENLYYYKDTKHTQSYLLFINESVLQRLDSVRYNL
jgi:hypothetical protein